MDWQPIETAPKDETWIILLFKDDRRHPEPVVHGGFWSSDGGWFDSEAASNGLTELYGPPIGWIPMPEIIAGRPA